MRRYYNVDVKFLIQLHSIQHFHKSVHKYSLVFRMKAYLNFIHHQIQPLIFYAILHFWYRIDVNGMIHQCTHQIYQLSLATTQVVQRY